MYTSANEQIGKYGRLLHTLLDSYSVRDDTKRYNSDSQ